MCDCFVGVMIDCLISLCIRVFSPGFCFMINGDNQKISFQSSAQLVI